MLMVYKDDTQDGKYERQPSIALAFKMLHINKHTHTTAAGHLRSTDHHAAMEACN